MIIDCISDLHGCYPKLEGGDLLIVAGDLTARHTIKELDQFNVWIFEQTYKNKIVIAGNHDTFFERGIFDPTNPVDGTVFLDPSADYLFDSGTEFKGLKIWGTPWSLWFPGINPKCTAFTGSEEDLANRYALIPDDTDILISHGPMYGILDQAAHGGLCGSRSLRDAVDRVKPKLLVCGHIHEQGGQQLMYKHSGPNTLCVNASYVNECYEPVNKPIRIEL